MINGKDLVLLVDDEPEITSALSKILRDHNYETLIENDGKNALRAVEENSDIDLILCDISMPVMNGYDFLKNCLAKNGSAPIVMITAHGETKMVSEAVRLGAIDYIVKPFDPDKLLEQLPIWVEIARRRDGNKNKMEGLLRIKNSKIRASDERF